MKKQVALFAAFLSWIIVSLSSCTKVNGKGPVMSETRNEGSFTKIDFGTSGRLFYRQGSAERIEIKAQKNILNVIETKVKDGELVIKIKNNTIIHSYETIEVFIESPAIRGFKVNGSGDIIAGESIQTDQLYADISGSGKIDLKELTADRFESRIQGSGDVLVRGGETVSGKLRISGSGDMNLVNLKAETMTTETSGSGDMRVWVTEELDAKISGSGSVRYKGSPQVTLKVTGSGNVAPY